jgi:Rod binding domain-containing protein
MDPLRDIGNGGKTTRGTSTDEARKLKLQSAARDFEAMFLANMLKSMRSSIPKSEVLGEGFGSDMMESLFDTELSRQLSRTSSLGLGEMLYKKLTGESLPPAHVPTTHAAHKVTPHVAPPQAPPVTPAPPATQHAPPATQPASSTTEPAAEEKRAPVHFKIGQAVADRINTYAPYIREAADRHGVDENLLKAVMASESGGNPRARSQADAKGLMQLIDSTAEAMGVRNVWNPRENILGGAKYLQQMLSKFKGNIEHAVASYNAGPAAVEKHGGIPPYRETQTYVGRVMQFLKAFSEQQEENHEQD